MKIISIITFLLFSISIHAGIMLFEWDNDGATEKGFRDGILAEFPDTRFYTYGSGGNKDLLKMHIDSAKGRVPIIYFAKGFQAVETLIDKNEENIPVIFVMFQDPVQNGVVASRKQPTGSATGITTKIPIQQQLKFLKEVTDFKRLGILKLTKSVTYAFSLAELKRLEKFMNFEVFEIENNGIESLYDNLLLNPPDAIYIPQVKLLDINILKLFNHLKIPTISEGASLVKKGALLALVIDQYRAGQFAAKQAIRIINGENPANVPVLAIEHFMVVVNLNTATKIKVNIPLSLLIIADEIIR